MADENGAMSSYVVQKFYVDESVWKDHEIVTVPARTKRRTIIEKAHTKHPLNEGDVVRVLDEESAREIPITLEEQPPRLKIG